MKIPTGFILLTVIFGWFSNVGSVCQISCSNHSTSETKIVGRYNARIEEAPFFVSIADKLENGSLAIFCGGSYVSKLWVVTAANCIDVNTDSKLPPNPGKHDRLTLIMELDVYSQIDKKQKRQSSQLLIHPNHVSIAQKKILMKDVALIKIRSPFKITRKAKIAVLPKTYINYTEAAINVIGWEGTVTSDKAQYITQPGNLQLINATVMTDSKCLHIKVNKEVFCAGYEVPGCHGDRGSPAIYKGMVVGVSSFFSSTDGTCKTAYVVYENVYYHLKWIREHASATQSRSRNNQLGRSVLWLCCIFISLASINI